MSIIDLEESKSKVIYEFGTPFFEQFNDGDIQDGVITVEVTTQEHFGYYDLDFDITGTIKVNCTRCNEPFDFKVNCQDTCRVVSGDDEGDYDGEVLLLHPKHKTVDFTSFLYETLALSLPIQIFHEKGKCIAL